jgi:uncharacterized protein YeaO (DUF488 family)
MPLRAEVMVRIKRAYDEPTKADGFRILVERLWPRGLRKADAAVDLWLKEIAPSTELRQWYGHDVTRWLEFKKRYEGELRANPDIVRELQEYCCKGSTTFVYAAHDEEHNSAVVLREFMQRRVRTKHARRDPVREH